MKHRILSILLCLCLIIALSAMPVHAEGLSFTASYGAAQSHALSGAVTPLDTDGAFTVDSVTGLPYVLYEIDVTAAKSDEITVALNAATVENERFALKAYNAATASWDTLATAVTSGKVNGTIDLATYAADGKVKVAAAVDLVANGSNRLLWSTDQQHYTKFEDLNDTYYGIHEYMVKEYQEDKVAYVINTGDIVDDIPSMSGSKGQWIIADKAFDILDEAGVPYGIVTGNHDVGDYPINLYNNYLTHFSASRYEGLPWYGGTPDDNRCHYDLVTVGNVDFLFLYIGYGVEDQKQTLDWADEVLSMYPHRNAVICTHQYLKPTTLERAGRAETLHNILVQNHENIVMALSGHYDGAGYVTVELENDRFVQEVVADYQFVQAEPLEYYEGVEDPTHSLGATPGCNGEGYMREIIVEGNVISMHAFSPITNGESPFGLRDDVTLELDLQETKRQLTVYGFAVADGTTAPTLPEASDTDPQMLFADKDNLEHLINTTDELLKQNSYSDDSITTCKDALQKARDAVGKDADTVREAYTALANARGQLEEKGLKMNPEYLTTVHEFDMSLDSWENGSGTKSLITTTSYIKAEALDEGGFTIKKGVRAPNNWPSVKYTTPITFTPEDGKVYLYLDLEAGSTWSCYPLVIQDGEQFLGRWNYIIEGSYNPTFDAGGGIYKGVFDVTEALTDMGVDVTKEMTLAMEINVVPGPVTIRKMALLTGEYVEPSFPWMWVAIGGGVILAVALVLFAILWKPKKKAPVVDN